MHTPFETPRLRLRRANLADAAFLRRLLNGAGWQRWIGDRGVRTLAEVRRYAGERLLRAHERHGFSMLVIEARATGRRLGLCGLVRRDGLDDVDLGYALLAGHEGLGLAREAAEAVLERGHREHGLTRTIAITLADNARSRSLLGRLGFRFERSVVDGESGDSLQLHGCAHAIGALTLADAFTAIGTSAGMGMGMGIGGTVREATGARASAIARLRHLYVHPAHRRSGLGTRLATRCLESASGRFELVRLRMADVRAGRFHAGLGFERTDEADATHRLVLESTRRTP